MIRLPRLSELKLPPALAQIPRQQVKYAALALVFAGILASRTAFQRRPPEKPQPTGAEVEAFFKGVRAGQVPPVRDALKRFPDLAFTKAPGTEWTALHLAGSPEVAEVLLSTGAALEAAGPGGLTPLHSAVEDERAAVVSFLVSRRASLQARAGEPPYTPLEAATARGKLAALDALLDSGARLDVRVAATQDTLLHLAARLAQSGALDALARRGVDPNLLGEGGKPALFVAASTDTAEALLLRGADPSVRAADGTPLLASVIASGNEALATFLLQSLQSLDGEHIGRALVAAAAAKSEALAALLVERRPEFRWQQEALFAAAAADCRPITLLLASRGAGAAQDSAGRVPFHVAASPGIVDALAEHGSFIDARDRWRRTPLFMAVAQGRYDVLESLLSHGADANAFSGTGDSPLLVACARGDADAVKLLVKKGAEPNTKNRWGATPLHYVARAGNLELAELLLRKGADPMAKIARPIVRPAGSEAFADPLAGQDLSGVTPLELAETDAVKGLLLKYKED